MTNEFKTIDDAICAYLDKRGRRTTTERGHDYWSASSLGKCKRYQVMCRAGIISNGTVNYSWRNAAEDGHMGHAWRQHALQSMGVMISQEEAIIDPELKFRGHYDLVVDLSGKLVLGDIKTQNSRAFKARARMPNKIDPCHMRQVAAYYYFLKRDKYPSLSSARIYYVNKNTGEREEIEIYPTSELTDDIIAELKALNWHWDNGILPKKEVSNFCRICQFEPLCRDLLNRKDTKISHAVQRSLPGTTEEEDTGVQGM